jgi:hypothetical protein
LHSFRANLAASSATAPGAEDSMKLRALVVVAVVSCAVGLSAWMVRVPSARPGEATLDLSADADVARDALAVERW